MRNRIFIYFIFFPLLALDQITKSLFSEKSVCNPNIAWSIPIDPGFFYFLWTIIALFLIYLFLKNKRQTERVALVLVFSGAASNVVDRITRGCVVDFIDLKIWPVFNLADIYIAIGILLLIVAQIKKYKIPDTKY